MINKVILMGRLTADPEIRQTQGGTAVAKFTVAINRQYADKQTGERQADFISVQAWRQTAEFVGKYFMKGNMIIVEGTLQNNNYTDQNGTKHYGYVVNAEHVNFGESKAAASGGQTQHPTTPPQYQQSPTSPPQQAAPLQQPPAQNNTMSNFEEVLSDENLPF